VCYDTTTHSRGPWTVTSEVGGLVPLPRLTPRSWAYRFDDLDGTLRGCRTHTHTEDLPLFSYTTVSISIAVTQSGDCMTGRVFGAAVTRVDAKCAP
jgi:hypothetical protein